MLNCNSFLEVINAEEGEIKNQFYTALSEEVSFLDIDSFPEYRGIYFLFLNNEERNLLYIGSAYGIKRNIKQRCMQYLQKGDGGDSFRGKISILKNISDEEAIIFITDNVVAKFIEMSKFDEQAIKQIEQVAIWGYQPPMNFILKKFDFKQVQVFLKQS